MQGSLSLYILFLGVFLAHTPAYAEIVLNFPYKLFGKCTRSPLNITPVNTSGFVQSHSKN
ncbi:hypothetical protein RchiOBHm_Chr5g0074921 [Rosa chinensis]|uniref:Uncharacterized protein n=1 Tax=Rosa chinensis TaxID=74649 RepID=A0A2P6QLB5_ROSCH|nr:hypothetical protein RchiOBHm_Chr5g0074921 [Rosa chinensis]